MPVIREQSQVKKDYPGPKETIMNFKYLYILKVVLQCLPLLTAEYKLWAAYYNQMHSYHECCLIKNKNFLICNTKQSNSSSVVRTLKMSVNMLQVNHKVKKETDLRAKI